MKEIYISNHLRDTLAQHTRAIRVIGVSTVALAGATIALNVPELSIVPVIAGAIMANTRMRERSICRVGLEGEDRLRTYLTNIFSDDYTALYNVPVERGDIDCLLIGPTGIYAIEVKHHKGIITYADNTWRQVKRGRNGRSYFGKLKSPSGQLIENIKWLKGYLKNEGINVWITGIVVFTHPEAVLSINDLTFVKAVKLEDLERVFVERKRISLTLQHDTETQLLGLAA